MRFNALVLAGAGLLLLSPTTAQAACTFLKPVSAEGPVVKKQVQRPKGLIGSAIGRTNWNTDFIVDQPYSSYKLFFTADSTDSTSYPIEAFLKFSDGSNLKVVDEALQPPLGTGRMFGPFAQVQSKNTTQVNFKVGANKDPKATGFSYRISVQGCR
ncbi:MAG: hypothetical protein VXZ59_04040 [Cyanobacteriota bacterium]|nr:hypothetical protein [Cyanobacteriota bacterium]